MPNIRAGRVFRPRINTEEDLTPEKFSAGDEQMLQAMERALLEADSDSIAQLAAKYPEMDADHLLLHYKMMQDIAKARQMPLRTLDDVSNAVK
ncbi:hypothetical protein FJT64_005503 [Amphibalanus amphitrite]|uniref:Uncharacterized protein n=1 Tax=Amphibalanus amphitrite TaxID=1232801 RepID=A0A6A4W5F3_AMPAM|nr:hypothetical protein FJT64_005503 [Amphibalanus amphitrite]